MKDKILLIIAFTFIFMGYSPSEANLAAIFRSMGKEGVSLNCLALLYVFFGLGSILGPYLCKKVGLKRALIAGAFFYPVYIGSFFIGSENFIYLSAVFIGIGGGWLCTSQADYLTRITRDHERNFYSSLLFMGEAAGIFLVHFVLNFFDLKVHFHAVYLGLAALALIGTFTLLFLSDAPPVKREAIRPLGLFCRQSMLLFLVFVFACSFLTGLCSSTIAIRFMDFKDPNAWNLIRTINVLMLCIMLPLIGKMADRIGLVFCMYLIPAMAASGCVIILFTENPLVFGCGQIIMVLGLQAFYVLLYQMTFILFKEELDTASGLRLMVFGFSMALGIYASKLFSFHVLMSAALVFVFAAAASNRLLIAKFFPKNKS